MGIQIVTDSAADIPRDLAEELGIKVVPIYVRFGEEVFREGVDITHDEFYTRMQQEAPDNLPSTAAPSPNDFVDVYTPILERGDDVISIHVASDFSGTYNAARVASFGAGGRERITVVDSQSVSMCLGWLAITAARAAQKGADRDQIVDTVLDMIPRLRIPSFLETLEYIRYGGRIGSAEAFLGSMLDVKPILNIEDGKVIPLTKTRTRPRALEKLTEVVHRNAPFQRLAVMHTHAPELAEEMVERLSEFHPRRRILVAQTGVAMGCHVGPGAVGVCGVVAR